MDAAGLDFERWYATERDTLVRALLVAGGDAELASDLVAEAFSRAYERWDVVGVLDNPAGWVYRVAVNLLHRRWVRARVERRLMLGRRAPRVETPAEMVPELWAAIAALPLRQREAIALRDVADLTERQVAQAMGVAEGTASATLATPRRRLASELEHLEELRWT